MNDIKIRYETRGCLVDGRPGLFHCWEHWSNLVDESPLRGGHPGGQVGQVYGIVEFSDGVRRIEPTKINFTDEDNMLLSMIEKKMKSDSHSGYRTKVTIIDEMEGENDD